MKNVLAEWLKLFKRISRSILNFIRYPHSVNRALDELRAIRSGYVYAQEFKQAAADNDISLSDMPPRSKLNPLEVYFEAHKQGKGIWKWSHYFDIYHRHFKKFVGREVHILEIGVFSGGSMEMWREYFGPKCHVYGVDIEEACRVYENEYTKIFIGDQADRNFWKSFKNEVPRVDIVIDDGGHKTEQQIVALEEMLPHISMGGVYLCEDIISTNNPFTSYLHGLVKNLNEGSWDATASFRTKYFQSRIKSMHFYPYVVVIEKVDRPEKEFIAPKHGTEWQPFLK